MCFVRKVVEIRFADYATMSETLSASYSGQYRILVHARLCICVSDKACTVFIIYEQGAVKYKTVQRCINIKHTYVLCVLATYYFPKQAVMTFIQYRRKWFYLFVGHLGVTLVTIMTSKKVQ